MKYKKGDRVECIVKTDYSMWDAIVGEIYVVTDAFIPLSSSDIVIQVEGNFKRVDNRKKSFLKTTVDGRDFTKVNYMKDNIDKIIKALEN
jgi:hypothetical protein